MTERVNLRQTHPTLFWSVVGFAGISIGLGFNFLLFAPPFNPFGIDRHIIGAIFLVLGLTKLAGVTVIRRLKFIRWTMAANSAFMVFWGVGTTLTFFTRQTSLQLPVVYAGLIYLQTLLFWKFFPNNRIEK